MQGSAGVLLSNHRIFFAVYYLFIALIDDCDMEHDGVLYFGNSGKFLLVIDGFL